MDVFLVIQIWMIFANIQIWMFVLSFKFGWYLLTSKIGCFLSSKNGWCLLASKNWMASKIGWHSLNGLLPIKILLINEKYRMSIITNSNYLDNWINAHPYNGTFQGISIFWAIFLRKFTQTIIVATIIHLKNLKFSTRVDT